MDNPDPWLSLLVALVLCVFALITIGAVKLSLWLCKPKRRKRDPVQPDGEGGDLDDIIRSRNL